MKVQLTTAFGMHNGNNIPSQVFNEVVSMRTDVLDAFAFSFDNYLQRDINYSTGVTGPLSIKTLLGISDFTKVVSINVFVKQLTTDDTQETRPLQMNYSITTSGGDVAMGKVSQIQFIGLDTSAITDITVSNIPVTANETTILSIIAFVKA